MAHVGQKLAFGFGSSLSLFFGLPEHLIRPFALCHVPYQCQEIPPFAEVNARFKMFYLTICRQLIFEDLHFSALPCHLEIIHR